MSHKVTIVQFFILISLFCNTVIAHATLPVSTNINQINKSGKIPEGLSTHDWNSIWAQVRAGKYKAFPKNNGGYQSSNPAHGWQISYAADGTTTLSPRDHDVPAYHLGMKLIAIGYNDPKALHRPQTINSEKNTIDYHWNDSLIERWINSETNLEQWFLLSKRPEGSTSKHFLTLKLKLASNLNASQKGNNIHFSRSSDNTTITYRKLKVWDATGRQIPAKMQLAKQHLSLLIDDHTARYPLTIDPSFQQQAYLKASNTDSGDNFGYSVAISGGTIVIGAPHEDSKGRESGAAYVFKRAGNEWKQQAHLKPSVADDDYFGESVAASGNSIIIASDSGAYIFTRTDNHWKQQAHLTSPDEQVIAEYVVAISGDTVVMGASRDGSCAGVNGDGNSALTTNSGAAYVFTRSGNNWNLEACLQASNADERDRFGDSVAISGNTIVIGAFHEDSNATGVNGDQDDNSNKNAGAAYIFNRDGNIWSQKAYLKASNTPENFDALFGKSVAVSGNSVVVGSATGRGAYVYNRNGNTWSHQAYITLPFQIKNSIGGSVAIADNTIVIGGRTEDSNDFTTNFGLAYIFTRQGNIWSQQNLLRASNATEFDNFGRAVAISGNTVVIGARSEDSNATGVNGEQNDISEPDAGAAYVYTVSPQQPNTTVAKEGLWWIPSQPGSGFDIGINSNNDLYMVWYTYRLDGRPIWYLASAPLNGSAWNADLLEFSWNGNSANSKRVGNAQINFQDTSHATLSWTLDTGNGSTDIEYFVFDQGSSVNAGTWFDPGQPGYGLTQVNQGATQVKVLYFYNQTGNPVWALGSGAATTATTTMDSFAGTCPACSYERSAATLAGSVTTSFSGQTSGVLSTNINLPSPLSGAWQIFAASISNLSE